jgi:hypothetical protein
VAAAAAAGQQWYAGRQQEHVAGHRFPWHVALAVFWLQTALKNRALPSADSTRPSGADCGVLSLTGLDAGIGYEKYSRGCELAGAGAGCKERERERERAGAGAGRSYLLRASRVHTPGRISNSEPYVECGAKAMATDSGLFLGCQLVLGRKYVACVAAPFALARQAPCVHQMPSWLHNWP